MKPTAPKRTPSTARLRSPSVKLRDIVQTSHTGSGRWFDRSVLLLIVASVVSMSLSTVPGLLPAWRTALAATEYVIVVLFTIEYGLRIATAGRRWAYIRSFYGIIDLMALLSFHLTLVWGAMMDLRAVRALRLLRLCSARSSSPGTPRLPRASGRPRGMRATRPRMCGREERSLRPASPPASQRPIHLYRPPAHAQRPAHLRRRLAFLEYAANQ